MFVDEFVPARLGTRRNLRDLGVKISSSEFGLRVRLKCEVCTSVA